MWRLDCDSGGGGANEGPPDDAPPLPPTCSLLTLALEDGFFFVLRLSLGSCFGSCLLFFLLNLGCIRSLLFTLFLRPFSRLLSLSLCHEPSLQIPNRLTEFCIILFLLFLLLPLYLFLL
jgi:hypothetical protein